MSKFLKLVERYTESVLAKPFHWLAFFVVLTVLAFWFGRPVVKTDLAELLPEDAPAVLALEEGRARRGGGNEYYSIAVTSPDPMANIRFMHAVAERIQTWEETNYVVLDQDKSFFRDHALLFLPVEDLENIRDNIRRLVREEMAANNPLFIDLSEEGDEPDLDDNWRDPSTWINPYTFRELGLSEEEVLALFPFKEESVERAEPTFSLPEEHKDLRLSPDGKVGIVMASVAVSSTDVDKAHGLFDRGQALIDELDPASFHPEMNAAVVGAFRDFLEVRKLMSDAGIATIISLGTLVVLLVLCFRSMRSVAVIIVPLIMGLGWALFLITLFFRELNTLTIFVFAMLIGMGIDYSIHIYQRALDEFHAGKEWGLALFLAITRAGRALMTAMMTTIAALTVMAFSEFDGFREFGLACAVGMAACLSASMLVLPVVIGVGERLYPLKRFDRRSTASYEGDQHLGPFKSKLGYRVVGGVVAAIVAMGIASMPTVAFEYNFRNLSGPSTSSGIPYGTALGGSRSSAPAVVLGDSVEQMREVHQYLRTEMRGGDERLSGFVTIETFLPADQEARMDVIDEIHETLDRRAVRELGGQEGELVRAMLDLTDTDIFTEADLPDWVREQLVEKDGSIGKMGLIYADVEWWNVLNVREFQNKYGTISLPDAEVPVASNGFILDNVVRYVQGDAVRLATLVTLALILILWIDLRSLSATLVCFSTLLAGGCITVLMMVLFDIRLGLYNMVVIPTIMAVSIDGSVHIYHRFMEEGRTNIWRTMRSTGSAVFIASITTVAGFIGLVFVEHKGIQTIGLLSVAGMLSNMVAVLGLMPAIMSLMPSDEERGKRNAFSKVGESE